jgi:type II secretory pathway pseudopilin PulG
MGPLSMLLLLNAKRCDAKYTQVVIGESSLGQRHKGYTILELLIASGIMFVLVTLLLSAWAASTDFAFMVNENLRRMEAIDRIRSTLRDDFEQSAALDQYDEAHNIAQTDLNRKTITLYPEILQSGREIRFVRMRSSITAATDPSAEEPYREDFARTNAQTLSQFNNAPVTPFFIISPDAETPGGWGLSPVWESNLSGLSFNQNANPKFLRIYRIVLIPYSNVVPETMAFDALFPSTDFPLYPEAGPDLRRGMLLRQYSNSTLTNNSGTSAEDSGRVWMTLGLPLSDAIVLNERDKANMFTSYYDGNTNRLSTEAVRDNEIRMKLTLAMQMQKLNATVVTLDLRLSLPFRRVTHGQ